MNIMNSIKNPLYMEKIYVEAYDEHTAQIVDGMHSPLISSSVLPTVLFSEPFLRDLDLIWQLRGSLCFNDLSLFSNNV
jgi:hypothetical protein